MIVNIHIAPTIFPNTQNIRPIRFIPHPFLNKLPNIYLNEDRKSKSHQTNNIISQAIYDPGVSGSIAVGVSRGGHAAANASFLQYPRSVFPTPARRSRHTRIWLYPSIYMFSNCTGSLSCSTFPTWISGCCSCFTGVARWKKKTGACCTSAGLQSPNLNRTITHPFVTVLTHTYLHTHMHKHMDRHAHTCTNT